MRQMQETGGERVRQEWVRETFDLEIETGERMKVIADSHRETGEGIR